MSSGKIPDLDTVVIGGGAVGLAVCRALALAGHEAVLLERHELLGSEISSRNSEVIHAGIYYPPGSLRARLCVTGKRQLYRFLEHNGLPHRRVGKLLVATSPDEVAMLAKYRDTAARNGVEDLQPLTAAGVRALEPEVACQAALLSPSTGIIDSHAYMLALAGEAEAHGAQIVLRSEVVGLSRLSSGLFALRLAGADDAGLTARRVVVAAGLHSTGLARLVALETGYTPPKTYYARGRYYGLRGRSPFQRLIYPMPQHGGLGIHLTLDMAGRARFGPDVAWIRDIDYRFDESAERTYYDAIRSYWPTLPDGGLQAGGTGIRPKLTREGEPAADFAIHGPPVHGLPGLVMLFGIESPGLTSSLAIADDVVQMLAATT